MLQGGVSARASPRSLRRDACLSKVKAAGFSRRSLACQATVVEVGRVAARSLEGTKGSKT